MWLLDTHAGSFLHVDRPREHRYAILSHVWRTQGEQSFQDLRALQAEAGKTRMRLKGRLLKLKSRDESSDAGVVLSKASDKIRGCCALARSYGYRWVWIDSCCVDKTSSTELSEAINSMYEYYAAADVCFAFLDDVEDDHDPRLKDSKFRRSRWFTRGWTLQELIAPAVVVFFSKEWRLLGTKESLAELVEEITGIERGVLKHEKSLDSVSVARRMSWASRRQTTREEDRAYSLMGIFGVNMSTIYGEGMNAFIRLQEEILKHVPDQSIFAWGPTLLEDEVLYQNVGPHTVSDDSRYWQSRNLFAWSPDAFINSAGVRSITVEAFEKRVGIPFVIPEYTVTSYGMRSRFPLIPIHHGSEKTTFLAVLACEDFAGRLIALLLYPQKETSGRFFVGHYVGRPQATPYAYFRTVSISSCKGAELLQSVEMQDVCVPYRQSPMANRTPNFMVSPPLFRTPCEVVVPGWNMSKLGQEGFAITMEQGSEDHLVLHVSDTTSSSSCLLVLRTAEETIQVHVGKCLCLGSFLSASVVGSGFSGLTPTGSMSSESTLGALDAKSLSSLGKKRRTAVGPTFQNLPPRCPTGHVATWEGGSKEFVYGLRRVRLTFNAWLTRSDVYSLSIDLDMIVGPVSE
ncbi:HET-domain-containing protein [Daedaleopsis nitida]|nr:HET-domain-containing protein [Daedaleopsis nitida]